MAMRSSRDVMKPESDYVSTWFHHGITLPEDNWQNVPDFLMRRESG
jgi:hypothetical protein